MTKVQRRIWLVQLSSRSLSSRRVVDKVFGAIRDFTTEDDPLPAPHDLLVSVDSSQQRNLSALGRFRAYSPSVRGGNVEVSFEYSPLVLKKTIPLSGLVNTRAFRSASFLRSCSGRQLYLLTHQQGVIVSNAISKSDAAAAAFLVRTEIGKVRGKEKSPHEGERAWKMHLTIERARGLPGEKKIEAYSRRGELHCEVCDFDFARFYDIPGLEFLCEAHHLQPVASLKKPKITGTRDLALVCANCHAVLHHLDPMPSIRELREFVRQRFTEKRQRR
jgi:hypothetical protein